MSDCLRGRRSFRREDFDSRRAARHQGSSCELIQFAQSSERRTTENLVDPLDAVFVEAEAFPRKKVERSFSLGAVRHKSRYSRIAAS